jgi:putative glycosyltransferase
MKLSIVTSLYYSAPYIEEFYNRICLVAESITDNFEIIFVNDGSPDNSLEIGKTLSEKDKRVRIIDLSKNFGHHKAIMTGLAYSKGDLIFQIDVDLEEEPEILSDFYKAYDKTDADVVYGVQDKRKGGLFEKISGALFYSVFNLLSSVKMPHNLLMARLMSRRYVNSLLSHQEREVALGGVWQITGYKQVPLVVNKHSKGTTTYTLYRRLALSLKHITSFSNRPLIYISILGVIILFLTFLYALYNLYVFFIVGETPSGFTSIILSIWLLGGLTIFSLGVIAIYLSTIFIETKNRPYTIVRDIYEKEKNGSDGGS